MNCLFCRETNAEIYRKKMEIRRLEREIETLKDEKKMCVCGNRSKYYKDYHAEHREKRNTDALARYYAKRNLAVNDSEG